MLGQRRRRPTLYWQWVNAQCLLLVNVIPPVCNRIIQSAFRDEQIEIQSRFNVDWTSATLGQHWTDVAERVVFLPDRGPENRSMGWCECDLAGCKMWLGFALTGCQAGGEKGQAQVDVRFWDASGLDLKHPIGQYFYIDLSAAWDLRHILRASWLSETVHFNMFKDLRDHG